MGLRLVVVAVLALAARPARVRPALEAQQPPVMVWAWEWRQDLRFLAGRSSVGVAFLAATVNVEPDAVRTSVRRQPLWVPPEQYLVAVVRTEVSPRRRAPLDERARAAIVAAFVRAARVPGVRGVQSDFDAPASLRADYRALLGELRRALPAGVGLTMTALGSWCSFDDWLGDVAGQVDEIVPMLFSMGRGGEAVWRQVEAEGDLRSPHCRSSLGLATYEAHPLVLPRGRRLFLFHRGPWDAATFERVLAREKP